MITEYSSLGTNHSSPHSNIIPWILANIYLSTQIIIGDWGQLLRMLAGWNSSMTNYKIIAIIKANLQNQNVRQFRMAYPNGPIQNYDLGLGFGLRLRQLFIKCALSLRGFNQADGA